MSNYPQIALDKRAQAMYILLKNNNQIFQTISINDYVNIDIVDKEIVGIEILNTNKIDYTKYLNNIQQLGIN